MTANEKLLPVGVFGTVPGAIEIIVAGSRSGGDERRINSVIAIGIIVGKGATPHGQVLLVIQQPGAGAILGKTMLHADEYARLPGPCLFGRDQYDTEGSPAAINCRCIRTFQHVDGFNE